MSALRRNIVPDTGCANYLLLALLCLLFCGPRPALSEPTESTPIKTTLFVHVNVVPMDREYILRDEAVLVTGGTIAAIGKNIPAPPDAQVIDGHGSSFLSPGLADMHVHSDTSRDMAVFLANGVTTVLNMGGARSGFMTKTRPAVNSGELPGPHVYAGFMVDGSPEYANFFVTTPAEARSLVQLAKTNGYDFMKVYNNLSPECFQALIEAGQELGIPVIGHGVSRVGLERQLAAGQLLVAHTEEYIYSVFFPPGSDSGTRTPTPEKIPSAIAFTRRSGAFVTADLVTYTTIAHQWGNPAAVDDFLRLPEVRYLDPDDRIKWRYADYVKRPGDLQGRLAFLQAFTKTLADAGIPLVTGTDTPAIPGLVPGFSLHQELHVLELAGLSRYKVLTAATRTPGELIARAKPTEQRFGTITTGYRADLVLTAGNPLEDLATLKKPLGVMANGHWRDAAELQGLLEDVAARYQAAAAEP
jgi:hypothetical protein